MKIFRNLRSLLPIPGKWSDEGKSFALKVEDAYKWLQTQMANDREDTEASKAKKILLGDEDNSWEKIWDKISSIGIGEAAVVYIYSSAMSVLSGGLITLSSAGVIWRSAQDTFRFHIGNTSDNLVEATLSNASQTSAGTFSFKALSDKLDKSNVYNGLDKSAEGFALDARQGKSLNDKKVEKIVLGSNDDTWAKIWTKISALSSGDTAGFYAVGDAYSVLSGGARSSQCMGIIARYSSGAFQLFLRFSNVYGLYASITDASSSSRGTYAEGFLCTTYNALDRTSSGYALDARQGKILNDKIRDDTIVYQASATTHAFTVASNSRNFIIFGGDGLSYTYIGFVYGNSSGGVSHTDLYAGSRVSMIGTSTNKITFTFSQASSCYLRNVNLRGDPLE